MDGSEQNDNENCSKHLDDERMATLIDNLLSASNERSRHDTNVLQTVPYGWDEAVIGWKEISPVAKYETVVKRKEKCKQSGKPSHPSVGRHGHVKSPPETLSTRLMLEYPRSGSKVLGFLVNDRECWNSNEYRWFGKVFESVTCRYVADNGAYRAKKFPHVQLRSLEIRPRVLQQRTVLSFEQKQLQKEIKRELKKEFENSSNVESIVKSTDIKLEIDPANRSMLGLSGSRGKDKGHQNNMVNVNDIPSTSHVGNTETDIQVPKPQLQSAGSLTNLKIPKSLSTRNTDISNNYRSKSEPDLISKNNETTVIYDSPDTRQSVPSLVSASAEESQTLDTSPDSIKLQSTCASRKRSSQEFIENFTQRISAIEEEMQNDISNLFTSPGDIDIQCGLITARSNFKSENDALISGLGLSDKTHTKKLGTGNNDIGKDKAMFVTQLQKLCNIRYKMELKDTGKTNEKKTKNKSTVQFKYTNSFLGDGVWPTPYNKYIHFIDENANERKDHGFYHNLQSQTKDASILDLTVTAKSKHVNTSPNDKRKKTTSKSRSADSKDEPNITKQTSKHTTNHTNEARTVAYDSIKTTKPLPTGPFLPQIAGKRLRSVLNRLH